MPFYSAFYHDGINLINVKRNKIVFCSVIFQSNNYSLSKIIASIHHTAIYIPLPGHALSKHECVCVLFPGHRAPPCLGIGLLHVRFLVFAPIPHVVLHEVQLPQTDQPPSTAKFMKFSENGNNVQNNTHK